jgi:hypothetical protein
MKHAADTEISEEIVDLGRMKFHATSEMIVEPFGGERCDFLVLLAVEDK